MENKIATYTYQRKEGVYPFASLVTYTMKVEVLRDVRGGIEVKFLGYHADGRPPGTVTKVWPKSIGFKKAQERKNDILPLDIRKPYKDD